MRYKILIIVALACLTVGCASNQPAASTSQSGNSLFQSTASDEVMPAASEVDTAPPATPAPQTE